MSPLHRPAAAVLALALALAGPAACGKDTTSPEVLPDMGGVWSWVRSEGPADQVLTPDTEGYRAELTVIPDGLTGQYQYLRVGGQVSVSGHYELSAGEGTDFITWHPSFEAYLDQQQVIVANDSLFLIDQTQDGYRTVWSRSSAF